jgi:hypothetical protein
VNGLRGHRALRAAVALLAVVGLAVHLVVGALIGLWVLAAALVLHIAGALAGHRWLHRRR